MPKYLVLMAATVIIPLFVLLIGLSNFNISGEGNKRTISFRHNQDVLEGTLILPADVKSPPFVLLVHGDGPQDRWSNEGYIPLVKFLVSNGIAVFSWDKPGVGRSTGDWLGQTMLERAAEASVALQTLREQPELKTSRGGYLGFSQAGWVVPKASMLARTDFVVLIGAAINWKSQGIYYMEQRLKIENQSLDDIQTAKIHAAEDFELQFTEAAAIRPCKHPCTRQDFERRNSRANATEDISRMHTPVLVLMGSDDRNVNPDETVSVWSRVLPVETPRCIRQLPGATHSLLRSQLFDYQLESQWPSWKIGLFFLSGRFSYSPGALRTILPWIVQQRCISAPSK